MSDLMILALLNEAREESEAQRAWNEYTHGEEYAHSRAMGLVALAELAGSY